MYKSGQDHNRRHRKEHDPTLVQKRRVLARPPDHDSYHDQPEDSSTFNQDAASIADAVRAKPTARPHHGQSSTDEEAEGAGVGSFVDPRRVDAWLVDQGHGDGGEGRAG